MNIYINTFGKSNVKVSDSEIALIVGKIFDMRPKAIEERLHLRKPIYFETAAYGHMGRTPQKITKTFVSRYSLEPVKIEVELFTWEKLDYVDMIKREFDI